MLTVVTGGSGSGKSELAEKIYRKKILHCGNAALW